MSRYLVLLLAFSGLSLNYAAAEEVPSFQDNTLSIPRVDTPQQVGKYQFVQFRLAPDGRWDLLQASEPMRAYIAQIEVKILESFPVQIHILVSGNLPTPCYQLDPINKRYADNHFEVAINTTLLQTVIACIQVLQPFQVTVPLDVYGLPAGSYQVHVNDKSMSFELSKDNQ